MRFLRFSCTNLAVDFIIACRPGVSRAMVLFTSDDSSCFKVCTMTDVTDPNADSGEDHSHRPPLSHPGVMLATWFGAGYLPKAPGTWGSLGALPFAWVIMEHGGLNVLIGAIVVVTLIGVWASKVYMDKTGAHDPGAIVIDEVAGQWIVLCAAPLNPLAYLIGFILFRVFDVVKPWPISWADKRIGGAWGVMIDDILAGFAGLAVMYLLSLYGQAYVPLNG